MHNDPKPTLDTESIADNYLHRMIEDDIKAEVYHRGICTRFPPEPNGYLHIGSIYAININHTIAKKYNGHFNLRFDDTNPLKEDMEYVNAIIEDMRWMGYLEEDRIYFGSDYSEQIYEYALKLIRDGKAYICHLNQEEMKEYRGTLTEVGKNSPYRDRSVEENLDFFTQMRSGALPDGTCVLRAKIDMSASNINMRDPVIYRIMHATHYRTGDNWCIYPMYDYAHPIQDAMENITHSLCSIEFRNHRPLYEWVLENLELVEPPRQREFGRMNMTGVVTSKRYLKELVFGKHVDGWDDPRLSTLKGLRRRGFTPEAIKDFVNSIGISRDNSTIDFAMISSSIRQDLKAKAPALMAVLDPLKLVITNLPDDHIEYVTIENNTENPDMGNREVAFTKEIFIERDDFLEEPVKGYKRLTPGVEVRLRGAYFVKAESIVKDAEGNITEIHCTYDPETKSGSGFNARKPAATIHWVSATESIEATVNIYDKLFEDDQIAKDHTLTWDERINPNSLVVLKSCRLEKALATAQKEDKFQFIRHGYFVVDYKYSTEAHLVFNRIVPLKDSWQK